MLSDESRAAFAEYESTLDGTPHWHGAKREAAERIEAAGSEAEACTLLLTAVDESERETFAALRDARHALETELHAIASEQRAAGTA